MPVLSEKFFVNNIENFINDVNSPNSAYYFFVGGTIPWPNDSIPPSAQNDYQNFEQDIFHSIVLGKQITNNNISFLVPQYTWLANTVYTQYDPNDANLFNKQFYVLNNNNSLYKCIDNNNGAPSTVQPLITPTSGTFQTSDGYNWKFMFTIPTNANTTFTSNNFVPVVPNTFVSNNAVPGTIDITRIVSGGSGYQAYDQNYITSVVDQNTIKIGTTGVGIDGYYVGSSIYLNGGLGANQLRLITSYHGGTQTVGVTPALNTFINLYLAPDLLGNFIIGESVIQNVTYVSYIFPQGYFNAGDTLLQSDTGASGVIETSNSTTIALNQTSNTNFSANYPLVDTVSSGSLKAGVVSITATSNVVTGGAGANLLTYSVNNFIQVGSNTYNNVRRITSITNSSYATVSIPFNNTLVANVHYNMSFAAEPVSSTLSTANGVIIQTNLNSIIINYGNVSSNSLSFILGETLKEYNANGVDQSTNAIVSFVNSTAMVLSSINGVVNNNLFLVGQSSTLKAQVQSISSYPNITLGSSLGQFISGNKVQSYYANGQVSGNATLLSSFFSPSGLTQYIISPTVNFVGDGNGAQAYSVVNTAFGANYPISDIVMINTGQQYTNASAYISSNGLYGSGANIYPVLSPAEGHGANAYSELGARYAGIAVTIDTAANENYYYPSMGQYRKVGIIKNPLFFDLYVNTDNVHRSSANITVSVSNNFVNGEIIYQPSTNSAGLVKTANSTFLELDNINGNFVSNTSNSSANSTVLGLKSGASSRLLTFTPELFNYIANNQVVMGTNNSANGLLSEVVTNNQIRLTAVGGKFSSNQQIFDSTTNAYANVISMAIANGTIDATTSFGQRFNQTSRLTLSSNNLVLFQVGEFINQAVTNANALILDTTHDVDLSYTPITGVMSTGIVVTDANSAATAIIKYANTTYLKLTAVNGTFGNGHTISTITANGTVGNVYTVLIVGDLLNQFPFQVAPNTITGNTSGAQGLVQIANTISYPDLIRNTGDVIYLSYTSPFTMTANSKSSFNLTVQM